MKNHNKYWFKRKRYGWGWVPVTWQGWLVIALEVLFLLTVSNTLLKDVPESTYQSEVGVFLGLVFLSASVVVFIAYKKGPVPKWRWGKKKSDDPELDF
ncbi:MAG: hypothetical protein WAU07_00610 [Microgenomates group bacterium]